MGVASKAGAVGLVELLDHFPLRAKKSRDFAIWREAVEAWCQRGPGSRGPKSRLAREQIAELQIRYVDGESQRALAAEFGIHQSYLSRVLNGFRRKQKTHDAAPERMLALKAQLEEQRRYPDEEKVA